MFSKSRYGSLVLSSVLLSVCALVAGDAHAQDPPPCAAPRSGGSDPTATDCLFLLGVAVGTETCEILCQCDPNASGGTTSTDAQLCLIAVVGTGPPLCCPCEGAAPCETTTTTSTTTTSTTSVPTTLPPPGPGCGRFRLTFAVDEILSPAGMALSEDGDTLFVTGFNDDLVHYFDVSDPTTVGAAIGTFGSTGTGAAQFMEPRDIAIDSAGDLYVVDGGNSRISKWASDGGSPPIYEHVADIIATKGSSAGELDTPKGIAIGADDVLYVADTANDRVQLFDTDGTFMSTFGTRGSGNGQFRDARGIAVNSSSHVYVADIVRSDVQKLRSTGGLLVKWGSLGTAASQFDAPRAIALDSAENVFVADRDNQRIQKFDANGNFLASFGAFGTDDGRFEKPGGVVIDSAGNVYVSDLDGNRIQKFECPPN